MISYEHVVNYDRKNRANHRRYNRDPEKVWPSLEHLHTPAKDEREHSWSEISRWIDGKATVDAIGSANDHQSKADEECLDNMWQLGWCIVLIAHGQDYCDEDGRGKELIEEEGKRLSCACRCYVSWKSSKDGRCLN